MDFGSVPDWIVAIAAALASWQGIKSLGIWRREEAERRRMELAEVALSEFYEARDIFKWVRTPSSEREAAALPTTDDAETRTQAQRDIYYPILKRLADDGDFFGRMRARRYRVQALFGPAGAEPYDIINAVHGKVALAAKMLVQTQQEGTPTEAEAAQSGEWQDTVWDDAEESDEINDRVELAIRKAEDVFRPAISV